MPGLQTGLGLGLTRDDGGVLGPWALSVSDGSIVLAYEAAEAAYRAAAGGNWVIPVAGGSFVVAHEIYGYDYHLAATALGIGGPHAILGADGHVTFTNNPAEAAYRAACGGA
jgi:hypothetical protein